MPRRTAPAKRTARRRDRKLLTVHGKMKIKELIAQTPNPEKEMSWRINPKGEGWVSSVIARGRGYVRSRGKILQDYRVKMHTHPAESILPSHRDLNSFNKNRKQRTSIIASTDLKGNTKGLVSIIRKKPRIRNKEVFDKQMKRLKALEEYPGSPSELLTTVLNIAEFAGWEVKFIPARGFKFHFHEFIEDPEGNKSARARVVRFAVPLGKPQIRVYNERLMLATRNKAKGQKAKNVVA